VGNGGHFHPSNSLTRAEAAIIFARMAGVDVQNRPDTQPEQAPFPDVGRAHWSATAVAWAADAGVVIGRPSGGEMRFFPNERIQRQEFAAMMERFARLVLEVDTSDFDISEQWSAFQDLGQIGSWTGARESLQWANAEGVITGLTNPPRINPRGSTTRAEAATMLIRLATAVIDVD